MNQWMFRHSDRNVPLKLSTNALSVGLPGLEKSIFTPFRYAHKQAVVAHVAIVLQTIWTRGVAALSMRQGYQSTSKGSIAWNRMDNAAEQFLPA
jgi:hypothetical protein